MRIRVGLQLTVIIGLLYAAFGLFESLTKFAVGLIVASLAVIAYGLLDTVEAERLTRGRERDLEVVVAQHHHRVTHVGGGDRVEPDDVERCVAELGWGEQRHTLIDGDDLSDERLVVLVGHGHLGERLHGGRCGEQQARSVDHHGDGCRRRCGGRFA
jgi:hypothetical protein